MSATARAGPFEQGFVAALADRMPLDHAVAVDGSTLHLSFASTGVRDALLPALAELEVESARPGLPVEVWAGARPPESGDHSAVEHQAGVVTVASGDHAAVWIASLERLPAWVRAHPLLRLLDWTLRGPRRQLLHAAAVGHDGRGALIVGRGGAGKSTLSLACLEAGLAFAGDDYVLVTLDPEPAAHLVYSSAKLDEPALQRLPGLRDAVVVPPAEDKAVLDLSRARRPLARRLAIDAVVVPRLTRSQPSTLRPESPAKALLALAPSTVFQLAAGAALTTAADLVRSVPCYALDVGRDVAGAVDRLAGLVGAR